MKISFCVIKPSNVQHLSAFNGGANEKPKKYKGKILVFTNRKCWEND